MAKISEYLKKILSARLGEEVRGSIHDSIKAMNDQIENDLGGMIEEGNEVINNMNSEIQNVETMILNGELNLKPEDLSEEQWDNLKQDLTNYYKRYESVYVTTESNETRIPINIRNYNTLSIIEVYIEGRILNRNEYSIYGTSYIILETPLSEIGTEVQIVVYRSVCASTEDLDKLKGPKGDSGAIIFNNVEEMKAANLEVGDVAETLGFYSANDGGAGLYKIVDDDTLADDGGSVHVLDNGLRAELIPNKYISFEIFGGMPLNDNTEIFQNMIDFSKKNNNIPIYISKKNWKIQTTVNLYGNETFFGNSSINSEESNFNLIYTGDNSLFDTNNDINLNSIIFNGLTFSGNNKMNNFANFPVQRATLKNCSFINFNNVFILKCLGGNVVENYFNNCFFLHCNYPIEIEKNTNYSYSDSIIDNCIFSDFIIAVKGPLLQWKITNNQFYSSRDEGAIYFGGYLNYIINNNFGTLNKGIIYDINIYPQNLTNNIIDNCQFTARSENYKAITAKGNTNYSLNISISNCSFLPLNYENALFLYCDGDGYYSGITVNNCQNVSKSKIGSYNNAIHQTIGYLYTFGVDYHFGFGNTAQMHIGNTTIHTTNDTSTQRNIGDLILNPSAGGIWACYGQYGNRKVLEQITNNNGNIQLTPSNYIRYVSKDPTNITTYNIGDVVIDITQGKIYISRGTYGCKELTVTS